MFKMPIRLGAALLAVAAMPAHAAWYQAKSKHFIIYSDDNQRALLDYASKLERFDGGARVALSMDDPDIGDGNRLTVFVLPTDKDVRALKGDTGTFLAGFYVGRVEGSLVFIPKRFNAGPDSSRDILFFHEYTHHLMMQALDRPYPQWYVEGFAEFFSTAQFDRDGSVWFGGADQQRGWGLFNGPRTPVESLLAGIPEKLSLVQGDAFYGRSWLLSHYLMMESKRKGQLGTYIGLLSKGVADPMAAQQAFGDFKQLDRELDDYRSRPLLRFKISAARIAMHPIEVTPLSAGAAQVILTRAKIKYGVDPAAAEALAAQLRQVEAHYPGDNLVESTLAEAELEADHAEAAQAAAKRALVADPRDTGSMVLEGRAIEKKALAGDIDQSHPLFDQAREEFVAANKLDTEDPEPLFEFYKSYLQERVRPNDNAIEALHYASDLAPQDVGVRMNSAIAYLNKNKLKEARATLTVVAYSPHSGPAADAARRMIADIDAGNGRLALEEAGKGPSQTPPPK